MTQHIASPGPAHHRRRAGPAHPDAGARGALPRLREGAARPAVDRDRRPDAAAPAVQAPPRTCGGGRTCCELADQAGHLVPVGRGGERRAIALANPALGGKPYATPTLWAAIQYLMPGEDAPEHRHTQHAFRFVVEGEGVWTVVGRDPVPMSRGDFLPQAGWNWHAHHNAASRPMAWIDGLDIPFQYATESQFFEFGRDHDHRRRSTTTPERSRSQRLWGHPGLRPVSRAGATPGTPLLRLPLGRHRRRARPTSSSSRPRGTPGRSSPATRPSATPTRPPAATSCRRSGPRCTGSAAAPRRHRAARPAPRSTRCSTAAARSPSATPPGRVARGDLFVVPSWQPLSVRSEAGASDSDSGRARPLPVQRHPDLRGAAPGPRARWTETPDEAGHHPHPRRHDPRRPRRRTTQLVDLGAADLGELLAAPGLGGARRSGRRSRRRTVRGAAFAPVVPRPRQDRLRRAELPQPHPRDGPRPARVPDPVQQVRRHARRRQRRHRACRRRPRRSTGSASSRSSSAPTGAPGDAAQDAERGHRRLRRAQRRHLPGLAVPHPRVAAGQELGGHHSARPVPRHPRRAARRGPARAGRSAPRSTARPCRRTPPATCSSTRWPWSSTSPRWSRCNRAT